MKTTLNHARSARAAGPERGVQGKIFRRKFPFLPSLLFLLPLTPVSGAPATATPVGPVEPVSTANPAPPAASKDDGAWTFASRLTVIAAYDDNIFIQPENRQDDFLLQVAPGMALGRGTFLSEFAPFARIPHLLARTDQEEPPRQNFLFASYTPNVELFARHSDLNSVNHDFRAAGRRERELWSVHGQFRFRSVEDANVDVGRRLRQEYYTADAGGYIALTAKTIGRLAFRGEHADYAGGLASTDARAIGFLGYQLAPKTELGLGAAVGHLAVASGADQVYSQPLLEVRYRASEKLSFTGQAGAEFRRFDSDLDGREQFVFALHGDYNPTEGRNFTFSGRRDTHSSALYAGENIVATSWQGGLRQRWSRRNHLTLGGGYVHNDYQNNGPVPSVDRRDDYYFGKVGSSHNVTERGSVELGYEYRANVSSASNLGFDENVYTLSASILF